MALSFANITAVNSIVSGSTLGVTITAAVGTTVYLGCAADNAGTAGVSSTSATITDAAGNTWTRLSETNYTPGGVASDGMTLSIWQSVITSALVAATVTINFSPNTTSKSATGYVVTPGAGEAVNFIAVGAGVTGNSATFSSGNVSVTSGQTIIGFTAAEARSGFTSDSDTTNGTWSTAVVASADTGATNTSASLTSQWKLATGTGNQSYDTGFGGARDYALNYIIVTAGVAVVSATLDALTVSSAATLSIGGVVFQTLDALTLSAAGALALDGTFAVTETPDVAAFTGVDGPVGILAASEAPDIAAFEAVPGWPTKLPLPMLAGYSVSPAASTKRLPQEFGAARVYRKTRQPPAEVAVMWQMTSFHMKLFDGFQHSILFEGGSRFSITLGLPVGPRTVAARFKDKLTFRPSGGDVWQVRGTLELLQRPIMTDAELTAVIGSGTDWPTTFLPRAQMSSWELQPKPAVARSEDLPGLPQTRQRTQNSITDIPARWHLTAVQARLFDAFFTWRGYDGAGWFSYPVHQGIGVTSTKVRFSGSADWTPLGGGHWAVSAPIEVRERRVMTAAETVTVLRA